MIIVKVMTDEAGEAILPISEEMFKKLGWDFQDKLQWCINQDGSVVLSKIDMPIVSTGTDKVDNPIDIKVDETELILVETVSMFRMRYAVRVPKGESKKALQVLELKDPHELSQHYIGEQVTHYRVVSKENLFEIAKEDETYMTEQNFERNINHIN